MTTTESEVEILDPEVPKVIPLSDGTRVEIQRIKMRQVLRFLKLLTAGGVDLPSQDDPDFGNKLLGSLIEAIPNAEDEAVAFVGSLVLPADLHEGRRLSKEQKEENLELLDALDDLMFNPELEDLLSILEIVIKVETPYLRSLGKRVAALLPQAQAEAEKKPAKRSSGTSKSSTKGA
jgi:hypothetical protein